MNGEKTKIWTNPATYVGLTSVAVVTGVWSFTPEEIATIAASLSAAAGVIATILAAYKKQ